MVNPVIITGFGRIVSSSAAAAAAAATAGTNTAAATTTGSGLTVAPVRKLCPESACYRFGPNSVGTNTTD